MIAALLALLATSPIADELSRLDGHDVVVSADGASYVIRDIAGEGRPRVGVVARDGNRLVLSDGDKRFELLGPLAVPRIAGPGYKVWVIGSEDAGAITVRRIGVLARPSTRRN